MHSKATEKCDNLIENLVVRQKVNTARGIDLAHENLMLLVSKNK